MFKLSGFLGLVYQKIDDDTINMLINKQPREVPSITSEQFLVSCDHKSLNIGDLLIVWESESGLDKKIIIKQYTCIGSIEIEQKKEEPKQELIKKTEFVYTKFNEAMINDPTCPPHRIPPAS